MGPCPCVARGDTFARNLLDEGMGGSTERMYLMASNIVGMTNFAEVYLARVPPSRRVLSHP
eukprot:1378267-Pyramimonas_sp.AAC.1